MTRGETTFSLTYDTTVVILIKIGLPSYITSIENLEGNEDSMALNLDLLA